MNREERNQVPPIARRAAQADVTAPDGSEIRLLIDQRHRVRGASMVEALLPAGQVSLPVWHRTVEEVWYILEGQGQVWRCPPTADPATVPPSPVSPGDAVSIPVNWRFQFSAGEAAPLRFLCCTVPPWPGPDEAQPAEYGGLGQPKV